MLSNSVRTQDNIQAFKDKLIGDHTKDKDQRNKAETELIQNMKDHDIFLVTAVDDENAGSYAFNEEMPLQGEEGEIKQSQLEEAFGQELSEDKNNTKLYIPPSHHFIEVADKNKPMLIHFPTKKLIYFGVFKGSQFLPKTVIMLSKDADSHHCFSLCQTSEKEKVRIEVSSGEHENEGKPIKYVSTRYSVAIMKLDHIMEVNITLIDLRKITHTSGEKEEVACIVGMKKIIFGTPPKTNNMVIFPYFGVYE